MPQLGFRKYRLFINLLQVYVFFLVWLRSTKAGLKTDISHLNHRLDIVASGVLKVQSCKIIMGPGNMNAKLKSERKLWQNEQVKEIRKQCMSLNGVISIHWKLGGTCLHCMS